MRVSKQPDLSGTITAHAGTGGNNVPMVMCRADTQANAPVGHDLAPTLMAHAKHDPPPHLAVTINGSDVFPALCATDGSKQFIDNQSIDGGRLIWETG